jgi:TPR repeat protein
MLHNFRRLFCLCVLLISLCLTGLLPGAAWAQARTALVIGNAAYRSAPLKNPVNDASDMAAALGKLGFDVMFLKDATMQQMEGAVREFGLKLRKGGLGLFYFAGHGVQVAGENYLVPVNAVIQSEGDVKYGCLNAGLVLAKMEDAGNGPNVVILDACRNNPFARSFRSAEAGLARMDAPTGSIIAYATAPGKVAADGNGRNGLYTQYLLRNITKPGLSVTDLFMNVREAVVRESGKKQVPWENTSLIGRFSFAGQAAAPQPVPQQAAAAPAPVLQQAVAPPVAKPSPVAQPVQPAFPVLRTQTAPAPTPDEAKLMQFMRLAWSAKHDDERNSARKLATPLAAKGSIYGKYALGWLSEDDKVKQQANIQGAKQGIPLAMVELAEYLVENPVSTADDAEARAWLQQALELGEPKAKVALGSLLIQGKGGPRDMFAGERLLTEAARELPEYNLLVGVTYSSLADKGLPKAEAKSKFLAYTRRGADLGDTHAMMQMGFEHEFGKTVPKDMKEAVWWFTKAAEKNDVYGMTTLGMTLRYGKDGVEKDSIAAARWFRSASARGDEPASIYLAQMTMLGEGIPKDLQRGLGMLKGLAEKGSGYAQVELGKMYEHGEGLTKNQQEAYYWYVVADSIGDIGGRVYRASLAKTLPAEQRAVIEAKAAMWKPKKAAKS